MSVVFTGTLQGNFLATGQAVSLNIRQGVDWIKVYNETQLYAAGAAQGVQFYWQSGMAIGQGVQYTKTAVTGALVPSQIAANAGFFPFDTSIQTPGPSLGLTGITGANPPVVQTANVAGLIAGSSIVRILSTVGAQQLGGLDFTVTAIGAGGFTIGYMAQIAAANPGAGSFRVLPYDPYYYPTNRYITKVTQAAQAIVTLSVTHGYQVGQTVRFIVPTVTAAAYGMTQLDGLQGDIVAIGQADADGITNTITVDIDTTGFTPFAFPLTNAPGFTPAQVVPIGESTRTALEFNQNILSDATFNNAVIGITLAAGANSPAGQIINGVRDKIYWVAGKSWSNFINGMYV